LNHEVLSQKKQAVVKEFGEWTAHNIYLEDDIYTIDNRIVGDEIKLRRIVQIVSDLACKPINRLRILDLACLEGLYAIEFARRGAEVVAIEGREASVQKARFVKDVLALDQLYIFQDDVRNLSPDKYGYFDVVLSLGILYHLDNPAVFSFIESIYEVCRGLAIFDTHISLKPEISYSYKGKEYWGKNYVEHQTGAKQEEIETNLWASLDNLTSFWFTPPSLYNFLSHVGFTSSFECNLPVQPIKFNDRITILAIKGKRDELKCCPQINQEPLLDIPEEKSDGTGNVKPQKNINLKRYISANIRSFAKKLIS
jgi:2-polyprenyl-3-methyl-5-hydroxy-6-metoxy-1,4-benzoquinol methylase